MYSAYSTSGLHGHESIKGQMSKHVRLVAPAGEIGIEVFMDTTPTGDVSHEIGQYTVILAPLYAVDDV
jgi:hypothetical protein